MSRRLLTFLLCLLATWQAFAAETGGPLPSRFVVIAHVGIKPQWVTVTTLRSIFSMRLHLWPDGTSVKVVTFNGQHPDLEAFSTRCLGIPGRILERIWTRNLYAGIGPVPIIVSEPETMLKHVSRLEGAIGYLTRSELEQLGGRDILTAVRIIPGVCK